MNLLVVYNNIICRDSIQTYSLQLAKCDVCQRMNRKLTTGVPQLHPIPVKSPWYMIGIDFVGPIYPTALCVHTCRYHQGEMRQHLLQCVQKGALTPFPSSSVRCSRPVEQMRVRLHCDCRLPEDGEEEMAYCPCCRTWFHKSCQNIADIVFSNEKTTWKCSHC